MHLVGLLRIACWAYLLRDLDDFLHERNGMRHHFRFDSFHGIDDDLLILDAGQSDQGSFVTLASNGHDLEIHFVCRRTESL